MVDENGNIRKISKHPIWAIFQPTWEMMLKEVDLYSSAKNFDFFDRDKFGAWDYFVINSEDLNQDIINGAIKEIDSL